jgi:LysR family glycine cleavage system transcriptional activator
MAGHLQTAAQIRALVQLSQLGGFKQFSARKTGLHRSLLCWINLWQANPFKKFTSIDIYGDISCNLFMSMPPFPALEVLEALARTGSVSRTADAVHLSQSAVSHKLRTLEAHLGFKLTTPKGRGIALTAEARRYAAAIAPGMASLRDVHRAMGTARGSLDVAVASGLAATWLAPRLRRFLNVYPEISLTMRSIAVGEAAPLCDLRIGFSEKPPQGALPLFGVRFFPLCSPDFLYAAGGLTPDTLAPDMLLHLDTRVDWAHWLAAVHSPVQTGHAGIRFTGLLAMYAAAEAGLGICLGDALTSARAISTGRLVRPFDGEIPTGKGYWITPAPNGLGAPAAAFVDWLRSEVAEMNTSAA